MSLPSSSHTSLPDVPAPTEQAETKELAPDPTADQNVLQSPSPARAPSLRNQSLEPDPEDIPRAPCIPVGEGKPAKEILGYNPVPVPTSEGLKLPRRPRRTLQQTLNAMGIFEIPDLRGEGLDQDGSLSHQNTPDTGYFQVSSTERERLNVLDGSPPPPPLLHEEAQDTKSHLPGETESIEAGKETTEAGEDTGTEKNVDNSGSGYLLKDSGSCISSLNLDSPSDTPWNMPHQADLTVESGDRLEEEQPEAPEHGTGLHSEADIHTDATVADLYVPLDPSNGEQCPIVESDVTVRPSSPISEATNGSCPAVPFPQEDHQSGMSTLPDTSWATGLEHVAIMVSLGELNAVDPHSRSDEQAVVREDGMELTSEGRSSDPSLLENKAARRYSVRASKRFSMGDVVAAEMFLNGERTDEDEDEVRSSLPPLDEAATERPVFASPEAPTEVAAERPVSPDVHTEVSSLYDGGSLRRFDHSPTQETDAISLPPFSDRNEPEETAPPVFNRNTPEEPAPPDSNRDTTQEPAPPVLNQNMPEEPASPSIETRQTRPRRRGFAKFMRKFTASSPRAHNRVGGRRSTAISSVKASVRTALNRLAIWRVVHAGAEE
ncbi:hypothetical protein M011DRAFT_21979 [Sporormia fimetaria CBS 119925]|uniref:Uncharacterized protein n=1 Tax=Sporormia fimetaria CBS 119925 TaxID=1340428 RepID=A0A6A6VSR7_9PLEO|nr:hypothetical protein M011DRAFT_21979 [Sporormia fimetaria CBS 119925]